MKTNNTLQVQPRPSHSQRAMRNGHTPHDASQPSQSNRYQPSPAFYELLRGLWTHWRTHGYSEKHHFDSLLVCSELCNNLFASYLNYIKWPFQKLNFVVNIWLNKAKGYPHLTRIMSNNNTK